MDKTARVVIGGGYGDEGKGLITDYFCRREKPDLVVRFNGGAQAGHTVVTSDGKRHIHHHFGSGTLAGVATYLSSYFIVNPLLFNLEYDQLLALGVQPVVHVAPHARVTTPFDMILNHLAETYRIGGRHGSCGVGINETVTRCGASVMVGTYVRQLIEFSRQQRQLLLEYIRDEWVPKRKRTVNVCDSEWNDIIQNPRLIDDWLTQVELFMSRVTVTDADVFEDRKVQFEGAQGLMLDEEHKNFPYVTRSKTGINNVLHLARRFGVDTLDVTYVTRAYVTRHGVGPLPSEQPVPAWVVDSTNLDNAYQGSLRYAPLSNYNITLLTEAIFEDIATANGTEITVNPSIAITCLDQLDSEYVQSLLPTVLQTRLGFDTRYESFGPTASHVHCTVRVLAGLTS